MGAKLKNIRLHCPDLEIAANERLRIYKDHFTVTLPATSQSSESTPSDFAWATLGAD